jgi:hypothetical protein
MPIDCNDMTLPLAPGRAALHIKENAAVHMGVPIYSSEPPLSKSALAIENLAKRICNNLYRTYPGYSRNFEHYER